MDNKRESVGYWWSRLWKGAGIYGIGVAIPRLGAVAMLPVYWEILRPEDFGRIALAQVVVMILTPMMSLGLYESVQRFYYEWPVERRRDAIGALWLVAVIWAGFVALLLHVFGENIFAGVFKQLPFWPYGVMAVWTAFASTLSLFPYALLRIKERPAVYTAISISMYLTQTVFVLGALAYYEKGALGYLAGLLVNAVCWGGYFFLFMAREVSFRPLRGMLRGVGEYGAGTMGVAVLEGVASVLDRVLLEKFAPIRMVGLYAVAGQVASAVGAFNQMLKLSWIPLVYRIVVKERDAPRLVGKLGVYYSAAAMLAGVAVGLLGADVLRWSGGGRYREAIPLIGPMVVAATIMAIGTALGRGQDLAKRMRFALAAPAAGIVVSAASLWLLVPHLGAWGAVIALISGNCARVAVQTALAVYYYPRPMKWMRLAMLAVVAVVAYLVGYFLGGGIDVAEAAALHLVVVMVSAGLLFNIAGGRLVSKRWGL